MLKRLELIGFKSFADKTRFDFAPGITGIVGPNGSGKSNVVDAVRWILGEQSAKSLRGGEMADVIFNGSSSRKSLGMAEVTLGFDNSGRLLAIDIDDVEFTRRVYRDGTGEYLINGQMARLKDIKDAFLGSGTGTSGYTIIAQGRVDELLQASTKDRREIFDEAAGISRFKAKKIETLRKLATVEANLTRSKDRLGFLDSELRTLRMQAAKAQKFQEYSGRLRALRVGAATREYREITAGLEIEQRALAELQAEVAGANQRTAELEKTLRALDREVTRAEDGLRHQEGRLADARQQIAGFDGTLKHERSAAAGFESELLKIGRQRTELGYRVKAIEAETGRATIDAEAAEERLAAERQAAKTAEAALAEAAERAAELERAEKADQSRQMALIAEAAAAQSTAGSNLTQVERLQKEYTRKLGEIEQNSARRTALAAALDGLSREDSDIRGRLTALREQLVDHHAKRDELTERTSRVQIALEAHRVRQGDLRGRIDVLEDLERAHDGLGAGVRDVLNRVNADSGLAEIVGLVADLLTVPHEIAPLVELALGDAAQRFVVRSPDAMGAVAAAIWDVPGRVGLIPLASGDHEVAGEPDHAPATSRSPLADAITCELPSLPQQLLGNVLLADSLSEARKLAAIHPRCRFITRVGELLDADGTLTIGPPEAEAGLVSRKSELRELREQFRAVSELVASTELELAEIRRQADAASGVIEAVESEIALLSGEAGDLQQKIALQRQQVMDLEEKITLAQQEAGYLEREVRRGEAAWLAAKLQAEEAERASEELKAKLAGIQDAIREAAAAREAAQQANTAAQVALSRATTDRDRARERVGQLETDLRKRRVEAVDFAAADRTARAKLAESTLTMLRASAGQAEAYREKELREHLAAELSSKASADRTARERVRDELHALREGWQEKQSQAHARELAVHDSHARREAVAERIREDYGVDLSLLDQETGDRRQESGDRNQESEQTGVMAEELPDEEEDSSPTPEPTAAEVAAEIEELKRKLARLGSVNMEALEELTRIETEFSALQSQHDDLNAARKSLQDVIDAINADSRKMFIDTLAAVRGYFQELFRKLFGGGQADIVLEEAADVLESGIEITARPPGKELRTLSLLSGGEKTLTAIALLLAIFRNKPSPFCILDEVDAALDEANTIRLAGVLREFLDLSQIIVVTHKKRTMAAADRLWGVTMLESGVSRLLPMRFEDWPDEEPTAEAVA